MSLVFTQIGSADQAATHLAGTIREKLRAGQHVLWLVPGGSAIAVAVAASKQLAAVPLENLTVTLTDERYGDVGHPDSNWPQLQAAGFALPGATLLPVLHGESMEATVDTFTATLAQAFQQADFSIGLFGIGADGHTAGMLPHSGAVAATQFAFGYDAGNFVRITMTPPAIAQLNEAVVYAIGEEKWPVLDQLEGEVPPIDQPAQFLKQVPNVIIYNDHRGEAA
jgi:6-phosphogluconolactonase/glucosamine-6-phosphate isomerase/deaminase